MFLLKVEWFTGKSINLKVRNPLEFNSNKLFYNRKECFSIIRLILNTELRKNLALIKSHIEFVI